MRNRGIHKALRSVRDSAIALTYDLSGCIEPKYLSSFASPTSEDRGSWTQREHELGVWVTESEKAEEVHGIVTCNVELGAIRVSDPPNHFVYAGQDSFRGPRRSNYFQNAVVKGIRSNDVARSIKLLSPSRD